MALEKQKSETVQISETMSAKIVKIHDIDIVFDSGDVELADKITNKCEELGALTFEAVRRGLIVNISVDNGGYAVSGLTITPTISRMITPP